MIVAVRSYDYYSSRLGTLLCSPAYAAVQQLALVAAPDTSGSILLHCDRVDDSVGTIALDEYKYDSRGMDERCRNDDRGRMQQREERTMRETRRKEKEEEERGQLHTLLRR